MSKSNIRQTLKMAALGLIVAGAPMAALAQGQDHGQPNRPGQEQARRDSQRQPDRQQQSHGPQRDDRHEANRSNRYRVVATVNLRSGPGTGFRRLGQLYAGRTITVDRVQPGWLHITGQGWISAGFARRA
ncbi:MAG: SH3 domain-containing protein [Brevundimonas sp.]|nr:MAG: SH3 domain-containing protein [Brevundimonas sp.]